LIIRWVDRVVRPYDRKKTRTAGVQTGAPKERSFLGWRDAPTVMTEMPANKTRGRVVALPCFTIIYKNSFPGKIICRLPRNLLGFCELAHAFIQTAQRFFFA
jgi:hypothetical protein